MNKTKLLAICLTGAGILAAGAAIGISQLSATESDPYTQLSSYSTANSQTSQETPSTSGENSDSVWADTNQGPKYRVSVYGEYVAVFLTGREIPYQVLETRVDSLPAYDQALLREGLAARDEAELTKILQDYES